MTQGLPETRPPNVLLVVADDLGFSDLGCYGGEINTPVLDGLADAGVRFSQFSNTARCSPSRASPADRTASAPDGYRDPHK